MISQGAIEQNSMTSGYNRLNMTNSGRILETNTENLLRMVLLSFFKRFEVSVLSVTILSLLFWG